MNAIDYGAAFEVSPQLRAIIKNIVPMSSESQTKHTFLWPPGTSMIIYFIIWIIKGYFV